VGAHASTDVHEGDRERQRESREREEDEEEGDEREEKESRKADGMITTTFGSPSSFGAQSLTKRSP